MSRIKTIVFFLFSISISTSSALEQSMEAAAPMRDFQLPVFGENGYKIWDLQGKECRYTQDDQLAITHLQIHIFSGTPETLLETTIESPQALLLPYQNRAYGEGLIHITGPNYVATGKNWEWEGTQQKIEVKEEVQVTSDTTISSNRLEIISEEATCHFYFQEDVHVKGTNLEATCDTIDVLTTQESPKNPSRLGMIERILLKGNVMIKQTERIATAGQAEILPQEGKVILTQNPMVKEGESTVTGDRMILLQGEQRAIVEGSSSQRPSITLPPIEDLGATAHSKKPRK